MRNTMLLAIALATVGCVAPNNPNGRFDLVAVDGHVSTNGRNFFTDGIPNPDVCVDLGAGRTCSGEKTQTYDPSWNVTLFSAVDGASLRAAPIAVDYVDRGLFHDVTVCSGSVVVTEQYERDGGFQFNCNNGSHASFELKPVR